MLIEHLHTCLIHNAVKRDEQATDGFMHMIVVEGIDVISFQKDVKAGFIFQ